MTVQLILRRRCEVGPAIRSMEYMGRFVRNEFYLQLIHYLLSSMPSVHYCGFCHSQVPTIDGMKRHIARKADCRRKFQAEIGKSIVMVFDNEIPGSPQPEPSSNSPLSGDDFPMQDDDIGMGDNDFVPTRTHSRSPTVEETSSGQQSKRARVEEVEDEDAPKVGRYTEEYPGRIADTLGTTKTKFENIHDEQQKDGMEPHSPFADEEEWELVKWLMKNVGQTKADDFLKLPIVSDFIGNLQMQSVADSELADKKPVKPVRPQ
jgi:hypothetical protein